MYIIVGLGNIGREYVRTRHNVGFMVTELIANKLGIELTKRKCKAMTGEGFINGKKVVIAQPETFMNNSGFSVSELMNWYKAEHNQLIVIYDDIDLEVGQVRIREKGSAGTHNGMRSIIYQLGYDDFPRVRVGIGKPREKEQLIGHVLSRPDGEEWEQLLEGMKNACDAAIMIVDKDIHEAQATYNKSSKEKSVKEQ